jgi:flavodoxin
MPMKILIVYYSYSGNTDNVIRAWADRLKARNEVTVQRLRPRQEITGFAGQCRAAFSGQKAELEEGISYDASPYELIMLGSPVWAFAPVPAMNTYLARVNGLHGKSVVVLLTSGSGLGVKRCFKNIRVILESKGASGIDEINIPDRRQSDGAFIESQIGKYLG